MRLAYTMCGESGNRTRIYSLWAALPLSYLALSPCRGRPHSDSDTVPVSRAGPRSAVEPGRG